MDFKTEELCRLGYIIVGIGKNKRQICKNKESLGHDTVNPAALQPTEINASD